MHARGLQTTVRREHGFTLIEMLVTMFIVGIVFAAFGLVISTTVRHAALITNEGVTQHQVRTALDQLTEDLREATVSSDSDTSPFVTTPAGAHVEYLADVLRAGRDLQHRRPDRLSPARDLLPALRRRTSSARPPSARTRTAPRGRSRRSAAPVTLVIRRRQLGRSSPTTTAASRRSSTTIPAAVRTVVVTVTVVVPGTPHQFSYSDTRDPARDAADMSRLLRRLRDESGQTMMLVVFAIALVSTLAVGLTDLVDERGAVERPGRLERLRLPGRRGRDRQLRLEAPRRPPLLPPLRRRRRVDPGLGTHHRRTGQRLDGQHHLDVPVRPGQLEGPRERLRLQPRDHGPERLGDARSRRRSRSSRPAAAGTAPSASAARPRTRRNARSRRCSSPRRSRTSR